MQKRLFWAHGYEATSTRDLVRATGLTQPSLYNAFGHQRGLFPSALEHYLEAPLMPGSAITALRGCRATRARRSQAHRLPDGELGARSERPTIPN